MCLYPKLIKNKKYQATKKNGGKIPFMSDARAMYVPVACGKCYECRKQKSREWLVRMSEELRENPNAFFVTLTINDESYKKIANKYDLSDDNAIGKQMVRLWLERVRKQTKRSVKHWLITELGHNNTERLHLHGIIFDIKGAEYCREYWNYGFVFIGDYVSERTINYVVKYMTKVDEDHPDFIGKVLCSPGIGSGYLKRYDSETNRYKKSGNTRDFYTLRNGQRINLPVYYRNKIYSEAEREALWIEKIERGERWIMGEKIKSTDYESINQCLKYYQERCKTLYHDNVNDWHGMTYLADIKSLNAAKDVHNKLWTER